MVMCILYAGPSGSCYSAKELAVLLKLGTSWLETHPTGSYPILLFPVFVPPPRMGEDKECLKIHRTRAFTLGVL